MRLLFVLLLVAAACAADKSIVTIYQDGYAVIRETRTLTLNEGDNDITIGDLPKNVMGESFQLDGRGLALRQFEFKGPERAAYALEQMLDQARGKEIGFRVDSATTVRGRLLQADGDPRGNIYLKMADGTVKLFPRGTLKDWVFYEPEFKDERQQGEIACVLNSTAIGGKDADVTYEAAGFQWDARYRLLLNEDSTGILEGWASVLNRSGKKFDDADVVLVEGKLGRYRSLSLNERLDENALMANRSTITRDVASKSARMSATSALSVRSESTQDEVLALYDNDPMTASEVVTSGRAYSSESHLDVTLYSLPYPATLKDSAQTEVVLLDASKVKAYQIYSFAGLDRSQPASVTLQLVNKEQEGLGLALPAAELQLFRTGKSGLQQFVGSHRLERTQAGDTVRVNLGGDPEIQCASKTLKQEGEKRTRVLEFEHTLKSTKSDTVTVSCTVRFNGELTVEDAPIEYKVHRRDERNMMDDLLFTMTLPPNEEVKAKFNVRVKLPK